MIGPKARLWSGPRRASEMHNPLRLVVRTVRDGGQAGRAALLHAGLSVLATPIDRVLQSREAQVRKAVAAPQEPIIIVVGPPRSGTTIVAQTIARTLPVSHLTNLTAMFPRSPLAAAQTLRVHPSADAVSTTSHYGRTAGLADHNDALPLWDRWLGTSRSSLTTNMSLDQRRDIRSFFAANEAAYGKPVVAKNNNLVAHAHTIGAILPTAVFLCMERDPLALAQSLLIARRQITGDDLVPYGLHPDRSNVDPDVLVDVVRQIDFYDDLARTQRLRVGADRFRLVSYDEFCDDPRQLISTVATDILGMARPLPEGYKLEPLVRSAAERVDTRELDRLRALLNVTRSSP